MEGLFKVWQNFEGIFVNFYAFGRIFIYTVCKWHNFEQLIQPSGHADHAKIDFLFSTLKISDTSTFIRQGFKLSLGS